MVAKIFYVLFVPIFQTLGLVCEGVYTILFGQIAARLFWQVVIGARSGALNDF